MADDSEPDQQVTAREKMSQDRSVGALIGGMCGDVLGAGVEGQYEGRLRDRFPNGCTEFLGDRGLGCYTDDTQMTLGLARSLVQQGACDAEHASACYAQLYTPYRGYGQTTHKILSELQRDMSGWRTIATKFIPDGSYANGGAMRIAPLGIAYRNAPDSVMLEAVKDALLCTHVHPLGIDGAYVQALGVAKLCNATESDREDRGAPLAFIRYLHGKAESGEMQEKLALVEQALIKLEALGVAQSAAEAGWPALFASPAWALELETASDLADGGFQIKATDAVACSLLALAFHWRNPTEAVVAAVHYGGDTDTIACMTGALAGALHGRAWIPTRWWDALENYKNGLEGRDELVGLAKRLAAMDVRQSKAAQ